MHDYDPNFDSGGYDYKYFENRGLMARATDEVRSWFGDEEAEERRRMDYLWNELRYRKDCNTHTRV
jgi:osmotically-inducible protein OsmY